MRARSSARALTRSSACPCLSTTHVIIRHDSFTRASSSSTSSSSWTRALGPGVNPAYDAALSYLSDQQSQASSALAKLRALPNPSPAILKRIDKLEVEAHVNDPAVRQAFRESKGRGMMDQPVMRHLAERRWKKDGGLDLVMGRVYQNKVIPDLLPDLGPTSPLSLTIASQLIEPGSMLEPKNLAKSPHLTFQPFAHASQPTLTDRNPSGLYTLLVVDPDNPSPETQSFSQRLQYLKSDIPLSILTGEINIFSGKGQNLLPWEPPAPERGSGRHRYVFILLQQPSSSPVSSILQVPARENFNFRDFMTEEGYANTSIVGINLFRATWSEEQASFIDSVFRRYRGIESGAPAYGKPPKEMKYGYPMSAYQKRAAEAEQEEFEKAMGEMDVAVLEADEDGKVTI